MFDLDKDIYVKRKIKINAKLDDGDSFDSNVLGAYEIGYFTIKCESIGLELNINEDIEGLISLMKIEKGRLCLLTFSKEEFKRVFGIDFDSNDHELVLNKMLDYFCDDILEKAKLEGIKGKVKKDLSIKGLKW